MHTRLLEKREVREALRDSVGGQNALDLLYRDDLVPGIPGVTELGLGRGEHVGRGSTIGIVIGGLALWLGAQGSDGVLGHAAAPTPFKGAA